MSKYTSSNNNNNQYQHRSQQTNIHTNYSGQGYNNNNNSNSNNNRSYNTTRHNNSNGKYSQQQQQQQQQKKQNHRQRQGGQYQSKFFPLHTSCDYSFILSRRGRSITTNNNNNNNNSINQDTYSFHGSDEPISWDSVRIVKYLSSSSSSTSNITTTNEINIIDNVICPICLDTYTCPRITKCGHTFCLSCWVQYLFTLSESTSTTSTSSLSTHCTTSPKNNNTNLFIAAKCPCCSQIVHFNDLKPLRIISVDGIHDTPNNNSTPNNKHTTKIVKFIKLHRTKYCSTPYIPQHNYPMYYHPYIIPCENDTNTIITSSATTTSTNIIDTTYKYCRYNYINSNSYIELLTYNKNEIQYEKDQQQMQLRRNKNNTSTTTTTLLYLDVSIDIVQREIDHWICYEMKNELIIQQQYESSNSNMFYIQQVQQDISNYLPLSNSNTDCSSNSMNQQNQNDDCYDDSTNDNFTATIQCDNNDYNVQNETTTTTTITTKPTTTTSNTVDETNDKDSTTNNSNSNSDKEITKKNKYKSNKQGQHYQKKYNNTSQYAGTKVIENEDNEVLFYQIEDGTLCFLSPFNIKCLKEEFSITLSPTTSTITSTSTAIATATPAVTEAESIETATARTSPPVASVKTERTAWDDDDDDDVKQEVGQEDHHHHHQDDQSYNSNSINFEQQQQQQQQQRGRSRTNSIISLASVSSNNSTNHHKYSNIESDNGNDNNDNNNITNVRYRKNSYSSSNNNNDDKTIIKPHNRPLPDSIEGRIIEIEKKQLTPELRERYRFLSHIPYYTDIMFIEIDINYLLSTHTKNKLYNDFKKRNHYRNQKLNSERKYDEKIRSKEQRIINERKAKYQSTIIDPNDEFFHPIGVVQDNTTSTIVPTGDDFGPLLIPSTTTTITASAESTTDSPTFIDNIGQRSGVEIQQQQQKQSTSSSSSSSMHKTVSVSTKSVKSFSSICKKSIVSTTTMKNNNNKQSIKKPLLLNNETDFPTLGAAMATTKTTTITSKKKW